MKGIMKMICPECNRVWKTNTNRKKCPQCGAEMIPPPQKKKIEPVTSDTKKCDTCGYRWMNGSKSFTYCQYILIEKHRRPCKGGDDCTAYRYRRHPFVEVI